jgi:hypothetical protein
MLTAVHVHWLLQLQLQLLLPTNNLLPASYVYNMSHLCTGIMLPAVLV